MVYFRKRPSFQNDTRAYFFSLVNSALNNRRCWLDKIDGVKAM